MRWSYQGCPLAAIRLHEPAFLRASQQPFDPILTGLHPIFRHAHPVIPMTHALNVATLAWLQCVGLAKFFRDFDHAFGRKDRRHERRLRLGDRVVNRPAEAASRRDPRTPMPSGAPSATMF